MNLTLMLYLLLTFLPVTLVKIELQKRALHQMNNQNLYFLANLMQNMQKLNMRGPRKGMIQQHKYIWVSNSSNHPLLQNFFHPIVCAAREGWVSEQPKMIMRQLLHIIILTNNFRPTYYFFFTPFFSSFRPNVKTTSALWPKCLKKSFYYAEPTLTSQSVAITHSRYDKQLDTMRP